MSVAPELYARGAAVVRAMDEATDMVPNVTGDVNGVAVCGIAAQSTGKTPVEKEEVGDRKMSWTDLGQSSKRKITTAVGS